MRRYDVVAEALAQAFDGLGDIGSHAVRRAGRQLGAELAHPGARSVMTALEPLVEMGAEYETRGGMVDCTNCLFAEVCRRAPVICRFHAGVLEGILEGSDVRATVKALGFRDPYGCAYMLEEGEAAEPLKLQAEA
jgi:predicted ArsR family transcriptional regulator